MALPATVFTGVGGIGRFGVAGLAGWTSTVLGGPRMLLDPDWYREPCPLSEADVDSFSTAALRL